MCCWNVSDWQFNGCDCDQQGSTGLTGIKGEVCMLPALIVACWPPIVLYIVHTEVVFLPERVNRGTRAERSRGSDGKFWATWSAGSTGTSRVNGRHWFTRCTRSYGEICTGTTTCMDIFGVRYGFIHPGLSNIS